MTEIVQPYSPDDDTGYVLYTGATSDVDLGTHSLTAKKAFIGHTTGDDSGFDPALTLYSEGNTKIGLKIVDNTANPQAAAWYVNKQVGNPATAFWGTGVDVTTTGGNNFWWYDNINGQIGFMLDGDNNDAMYVGATADDGTGSKFQVNGSASFTGATGSLLGQININAPGGSGASQSSINFENMSTTAGYFIGHSLFNTDDHNFFWYDRIKGDSPIYIDGSGTYNNVYLVSNIGGNLPSSGNLIIGDGTDSGSYKVQINGGTSIANGGSVPGTLPLLLVGNPNGQDPSCSGAMVSSPGTADYDRMAFYQNNSSNSRVEYTLANAGDGSWTYNFMSLMVHGSTHPNKNYPTAIGTSTDAGKSILLSQSNGGIQTEFIIGSPNNIPVSIFSGGISDSNIVVTFNSDGAGATSFTGSVTATSFNPSSKQTYTASNVTTDRTYDANSTTVNELADVLGTLIADLRTIGLIN